MKEIRIKYVYVFLTIVSEISLHRARKSAVPLYQNLFSATKAASISNQIMLEPYLCAEFLQYLTKFKKYIQNLQF